MAYHEKLHIPATRGNSLCRKEITIYGVLFIHYEIWMYGENKTETSVRLDQVTYIGKK